MNSRHYVTLMYEHLLGRKPDVGGLDFYAAELERTGDLRLVVDALAGSDEFVQSRTAGQDPELVMLAVPAH